MGLVIVSSERSSYLQAAERFHGHGISNGCRLLEIGDRGLLVASHEVLRDKLFDTFQIIWGCNKYLTVTHKVA